MLALRYAALLALVVWVGGLVALGAVAAPVAFDVMAARQIPDSRVVAGAIFGEMLGRFHYISYVCGAVLPGSLMVRGVLGPRPHRFGLRIAVSFLMLAAVLYSGLLLAPRITRLQQSIGVAPSSLPAGDARRVAFGRLHVLSIAVQLVPLLGGLLLVAYEMKD